MTEFEWRVGNTCGTAMAGIKPASLAVCDLTREEKGEVYLSLLSEQFKEQGIRFEILNNKNGKLIYLVFREKVLEKHLKTEENRVFLSSYGYCFSNLEDALEKLRSRIKQQDFPHEIGVFLGYPLEDINGFIQNPKGCIFSGFWKVYAEPEKRRELFARYKKCTACILKRIEQGHSLNQIFVA